MSGTSQTILSGPRHVQVTAFTEPSSIRGDTPLALGYPGSPRKALCPLLRFEWVLRMATSILKRCMDAGLEPMMLTVNLSVFQFCQTNITERIRPVHAAAPFDM
jgi:hypothetical protein